MEIRPSRSRLRIQWPSVEIELLRLLRYWSCRTIESYHKTAGTGGNATAGATAVANATAGDARAAAPIESRGSSLMAAEAGDIEGSLP